MKTYYIVVHKGKPVGVYEQLSNAETAATEWSLHGNEASILPVSPIQLELAFEDFPIPSEPPSGAV